MTLGLIGLICFGLGSILMIVSWPIAEILTKWQMSRKSKKKERKK